MASGRICHLPGGAPYQQDTELDMVNDCFLDGAVFSVLAYDFVRQYLYVANSKGNIYSITMTATRFTNVTVIVPSVTDLKGRRNYVYAAFVLFNDYRSHSVLCMTHFSMLANRQIDIMPHIKQTASLVKKDVYLIFLRG